MKATIKDCSKLRKLMLALKKERDRSDGIVSNCLVRAIDDRLEFIDADYGRTDKRLTLAADVEEPGELCVDIMTLDKTAKNLKKVGGELTIKDDPETEDWALLQHDQIETRLIGEHPDDYLALLEPDVDVEYFDAEEVFRVLEAILPAISTDGSREHLTGALFGGADVVATDGHRLRQCRIEGADFEGKIVPRKAVKLARYFWKKFKPDQIGIGEDDDCFVFEIGDHRIATQEIYGTFPDYLEVMPNDSGTTARVDVSDTLQALDLLEPVISSKTNNVRTTIEDGSVELYASDPDAGESRTPIDAETEGERVKAGFNVDYLADSLESFEDETVEIEIIDTLSPCLIREDSRPDETAVVMPMRL